MQLKKNINLGKIKIFKFIYLVTFILLFGIKPSLSSEDFVEIKILDKVSSKTSQLKLKIE